MFLTCLTLTFTVTLKSKELTCNAVREEQTDNTLFIYKFSSYWWLENMIKSLKVDQTNQ